MERHSASESRPLGFLVRLLGNRRGVSSVEYALLLAGILLVAAVGYRVLGTKSKAAVSAAEATFHGDVQWTSGNGTAGGGGGIGGPVGGGSGDGSGNSVCDGRSCTQPGSCFVAGTAVATPSGEQPIESLRAGDLVLSRGEQDDAVRPRAIVKTFVRPAHSLVDVHLETADGARETIRSTPDHLYFTQGARRWVAAAELAAGEALVDASGREIRVTEVVPILQEAPVYNFEVEVDHTYFVGRSTAWVHNPHNCGGGPSAGTGPVVGSTWTPINNGLPPGVTPNGDIKVLGRLNDTKNYIGKAGHDVLNDPNWTLAKNDAWVQAGIDNHQNFYLSSDPSTNLVQTTGKYAGQPTVYARELAQLKAAGYVQIGNYMVNPANLPKGGTP